MQKKNIQLSINGSATNWQRIYVTIDNVIKLNWLPVKEKIQFNTVELVHKDLYKEGFTGYLKLELTYNIKTLQSNTETRITPFQHKNLFTYGGTAIFNVTLKHQKPSTEKKKKIVSAAN